LIDEKKAGSASSIPDNTRRTRAAACLGVLFAVAVFLGLFAWWNATTEPVIVGRPHTFMGFALLYHHDPELAARSMDLPPDPLLFRLSSAVMDRFGDSYAVMMSPQLALFALLIVILAAIGWRLGGTRAALLTAAFGASMPLVANGARIFDDHLFNMVMVSLCVALFLFWRRFPRPLPMAAAGLCAGLAMRNGFIASSGLLVLGTVAAAGLGVAAERFFDRPESPEPRMGKTAVGVLQAVLCVALFFLVFCLVSLRPEVHGGEAAAYYSRELGPQGRHASVFAEPLSLLAYPYFLARCDLGPFLTLAVLLGLAALFRGREKGRFVLSAWLFLPLLVLSFVSKKNFYYDDYAALAAAPIAGVGLAAIPWKRLRPFLAGALCLACFFYTGGKLVFSEPPPRLSPVVRYFQTPPSFFLSSPRKAAYPEKEEARRFLEAMKARRPEARPDIVLPAPTPPLDMVDRLRYHLLRLDPRVRLFVLPRDHNRLSEIGDAPFFLHLVRHFGKSPPDTLQGVGGELLSIYPSLSGEDGPWWEKEFSGWLSGFSSWRLVLPLRSFALYDLPVESP